MMIVRVACDARRVHRRFTDLWPSAACVDDSGRGLR